MKDGVGLEVTDGGPPVVVVALGAGSLSLPPPPPVTKSGALGVGVGNAVITVDETADLDDAAEKIVTLKDAVTYLSANTN